MAYIFPYTAPLAMVIKHQAESRYTLSSIYSVLTDALLIVCIIFLQSTGCLLEHYLRSITHFKRFSKNMVVLMSVETV